VPIPSVPIFSSLANPRARRFMLHLLGLEALGLTMKSFLALAIAPIVMRCRLQTGPARF